MAGLWAETVHHLHDASINATVAETFATHTDRVAGLIEPGYQAPHSTSHPAASVVYWQLLIGSASPLGLSVVNVCIFALGLPVMLWALRRWFDDVTALQGALACLLVPALLVYGRSDDAVFYALVAMTMAVSWVALDEGRYALSAAAGCLLALAASLSYGAVVLLPAMYSFNTDVRTGQLWGYLRRALPHAAVVVAVVALAVVGQAWLTGFHLLDGFLASVQKSSGTTMVAILSRGDYARALNERVMAISDFLIFAGPVLLYVLIGLARNMNRNVAGWRLRNLALAMLLGALAVHSNGPGEVSRPWGGLFVFLAFAFLAEFLAEQKHETRWWLLRLQFCWALALQVPLHFSW
jgi:hypothetical protein